MERKAFILEWEDKEKMLDVLKEGGIVAFPTDTVYGLAVISSSEEAFDRLVKVKKRTPDKPFTMMCSSLGMAARYAEIDQASIETMKEFFPGEVTALLRARKGVPDWVTLGTPTIGIRVPDDPNIIALIDALGVPLLVPSANISSFPALTAFEEVKKTFEMNVQAIVRGECEKKVASTIIDLSTSIPKLVRTGPVPFDEIEKVYEAKAKNPINVVIGSDHGGYHAKEAIKEHLKKRGYYVDDVGTNSMASCDYPFFALDVAKQVANKEAPLGIVVCTSGQGVMITANKVKGIRCGMGYDDMATAKAREHNNANVIAFGEKYMALEDILRRVDIFLSEKFSTEEKHIRRVAEIG